MPTHVSPITGALVETHPTSGSDMALRTYVHEPHGFGDLILGRRLADDLKFERAYADGDEAFTLEETRAAIELIRSWLWRSRRLPTKTLVVAAKAELESVADTLKRSGTEGSFVVRTFGEFVADTKALNFIAKAMQTLENVHIAWRDRRRGVEVPYVHYNSVTHITSFAVTRDAHEDGMTYGCGLDDGPFVYEFLFKKGFLIHQGGEVMPTGDGMVEIDRLRRGKDADVRRAFFVRAWSPGLDEVLRPIADRVGKRLGCAIRAVWEEEHNERLDERIFRLIREASVVVVDISHVPEKPDRFNVGLELGYAYALGKPIVLIRQKPPNEGDTPRWVKEIPFDVSTLNCHDYDTTQAGKIELERKLEARIGLELDLIDYRK